MKDLRDVRRMGRDEAAELIEHLADGVERHGYRLRVGDRVLHLHPRDDAVIDLRLSRFPDGGRLHLDIEWDFVPDTGGELVRGKKR